MNGSDSKARRRRVNCSSHWFEVSEGLVAVGWYEQGTRFLDVHNPRDIRQVGFYLPANGSTWGAYWSPDRPDAEHRLHGGRLPRRRGASASTARPTSPRCRRSPRPSPRPGSPPPPRTSPPTRGSSRARGPTSSSADPRASRRTSSPRTHPRYRPAMRFAPTDVGFIADPYRDYEELRRSAPVVYDEATDHWLISRYRDVDALLRDRRFGRTYLHMATHEEMGRPTPPEWHGPFWDLINAGILDMEPPDHTRVRQARVEGLHAEVRRGASPSRAGDLRRAGRRGRGRRERSTCCPPWPSRSPSP